MEEARISDVDLHGPSCYCQSSNQVHGDLPRIAPEVLRGENYNTASDVYSFGIVMNTFATGKGPWKLRGMDL